MKEVFFELLFAGITFMFFVVFLILGLLKKKKNLVITSIVILFISIIAGSIAIFTITKKTYHITKKVYNEVSELSKPRTGMEIYDSLLGKPETNCVEILNYQDQTAPIIDYAILLHFKTCPQELKRILAQKEFEFEKIKTSGLSSDDDWFEPEKMGDSILTFKYYDTNGNGQEIYSSKDSTEVFLKDILN
ncbi:hypothetical protein [Epilithonimonas xixisoli]|uniref:Uncharacterized protein n=1 Tax=Epilithonimonas xixisoli TaxID=1476462 RepID=A0A4R8IDK1_9FLAO|nr:hypothetical protein [Epilithonimonas xixisoli]TDX83101.1 hypothetical protein B0I22_3164 [Epilithonimonas xixisoli]